MGQDLDEGIKDDQAQNAENVSDDSHPDGSKDEQKVSACDATKDVNNKDVSDTETKKDDVTEECYNNGQDESSNADTKEKSSFFSKKKKKDKKDEQIEELNDKVMRTMAEFENFRKRNEREKTHMYEVGARDVIEKILPVVDSFERGLASIPEEDKGNAVAEGMERIYRQLQTAFEEIGVTEIEAVGKEFDPDFHNAVMHEDNEEVGENMVTEEFQKGYMYRESVVRHSMVKVAN